MQWKLPNLCVQSGFLFALVLTSVAELKCSAFIGQFLRSALLMLIYCKYKKNASVHAKAVVLKCAHMYKQYDKICVHTTIG